MKRTGIFLLFGVLIGTQSPAQRDPGSHLDRIAGQAYDVLLTDPDKALILAQKTLDEALSTSNVYYEGCAYYVLSKGSWVKANYKLSMEYGFKGLKTLRDTEHYEPLAAIYLGLARTLIELGNTTKAHTFIHEALELGIRHSNASVEAAAYREHSYLLTELNKLDSALYYSDKSLAIYEKLGDSLDVSILLGRKSRIFFQQGKYEESRRLAYQGLMIDSLVGNRRGLGISHYLAAQNEYALGNKLHAVSLLKHSIHISSEIGNLNWQIKAHELLSSYYLEQNNMHLAAKELQEVSKLKDELYNSERSGQIQEMQSLHELEAKENTIQLLERDNAIQQQQVKNQRLFTAFLMVTVLFLTLLIFVLTRLREIQKKTNRNLENQNYAIEQQRIAIQTQAENLQQLDHLKTKLFSVISHDLRGPISNLQALLDMFTQNLMTADEFIGLSSKLKENLDVTQRTLENLLNWSLSQMGGIRTEQTVLDVTTSLTEVCRLMKESAARKNVTLHVETPGKIKVWADPNQLQVVLRNLIHNAIKFSSFNDLITLTAIRENDQCVVSVKDRGIGMTPQEIETIKGSQQYFSKTGTEQERGTGLGLLLCKEFITRNGGQLSITSMLGEGTEVSFTLSLAEEDIPRLALKDQ